jgi:hypothetical protein
MKPSAAEPPSESVLVPWIGMGVMAVSTGVGRTTVGVGVGFGVGVVARGPGR